jgi:hypothetical protein
LYSVLAGTPAGGSMIAEVVAMETATVEIKLSEQATVVT